MFQPERKVFIKSRITNWYKNSATKKDWYRIYFRNSIDKSCITITGDHPLLTNHGWKKVKEIRPDEKVFRFDKKITISGQQALLGMFIG